MTQQIPSAWPEEPLWPDPLELALSAAGWVYEWSSDGSVAGWADPDDPNELHYDAPAAYRALQRKRRAEAEDS